MRFIRLIPVAFLILLTACGPIVPTEEGVTVTLIADGETRVLTTTALTVRDLLDEAGLTLDADDLVTPVEPTLLADGMIVRVVRVEIRTETEQREIPFERRTVRDASVPVGETRLLEPGITGLEELTYRVRLEDGVEVERQLIRRVVLRETRTEVILVGAQAEHNSVPISGTIAYLSDRNGWVIQVASPNRRRLTHTGDLDGRVFALSSDGGYLLFTRVATDSLNSLWLVETATTDAEPVRLDAADVLWAGWEPGCQVSSGATGCRIAYSTGRPTESSPGWKANNDLWIARPDPRTGRLPARREAIEQNAGGAYGWWGTTYAWRPDRHTLAYSRADEIGLVRAYDGRRTVLARFPPYRTYAPWVWTPTVNWSPEGEFIVTTLHGPAPTGGDPEDSPVFDVWAIRADGTISAVLSSAAGMWAAPQYAPVGGLVAFGHARSPYASQSGGYDLYLVDRDGSNHRQLFPPADEIGLDYPEMAWSPQGDTLAVVYQGNLYLLTVADGAVNQLTDDGGVTAVRWR